MKITIRHTKTKRKAVVVPHVKKYHVHFDRLNRGRSPLKIGYSLKRALDLARKYCCGGSAK